MNNPIDSATIDQITNDQIVNSSDTLTATGLTTLWGKIKSLFALKTHTHGAAGIDDKAITQAKIADGAVGETQLETSLRNSIFRLKDLEIRQPADTYFELYLKGKYGTFLIQIHSHGMGYFRIGEDGSEHMLGYSPWAAS